MPRRLDCHHLISLQDRWDEAATRELVDYLVEGDDDARRDAARALAWRELPADALRRVAALLVDDTLDGAESTASWPLSIAARALLELTDEEEIFSIAEPLLRVTAASRPFDRLRAKAIVGALEACLARYWRNNPLLWLGGRRFRPFCEQLARDDPSLSYVTAEALKAFRYFDGEDVEPVARTVSLGEGDDPPFPFLVAGFPVGTGAQRQDIDAALADVARGRPPGLAWFQHQYGGLACAQIHMLGYGLILPEEPPIVEAVSALSKTFTETRGEPMSAADLRSWSDRLAPILPPEGAERGTEALLLGAPCSPIRTLAGRDVLGFGYDSAPWRSHVNFHLDMEPDFSRRGTYGEEHDRVLARVGETLGLGSPRIALLWGNSD